MRALIVTEDHKVQRKPHLPVAFYNFIRYNGTGEEKSQAVMIWDKTK